MKLIIKIFRFPVGINMILIGSFFNRTKNIKLKGKTELIYFTVLAHILKII